METCGGQGQSSQLNRHVCQHYEPERHNIDEKKNIYTHCLVISRDLSSDGPMAVGMPYALPYRAVRYLSDNQTRRTHLNQLDSQSPRQADARRKETREAKTKQ